METAKQNKGVCVVRLIDFIAFAMYYQQFSRKHNKKPCYNRKSRLEGLVAQTNRLPAC